MPRYTFEVPPHTNGGESLLVSTEITNEGNIACQEIELYSYANSASFHLGANVLTPSVLRQLADELEFAMNIAQSE